ncbi:TPA: hypothetical protein ACG3PB_003807 [Clostridioides difficile]
MSIKKEATKLLIGSASRVGTKLARQMVQLPSLNFRYNLIDKADRAMLNGVHKVLSAPSNLLGEAKETLYEARRNKNQEDINLNNSMQYNLNQMLQESQIQSHEPLYKPTKTIDIGLAEQMASLELASKARRNLNNNFKR